MAAGEAVTLRVAGALSGVVTLASLHEPVSALRLEVARQLGLPACDASTLKLIASGVVLSDDCRRLCDCGISAVRCILVIKGAAAASTLNEAASRLAHLERVQAAAERFASRSFTSESFRSVHLENQAGAEVAFSSDVARRSVVTGMLLHAHGRKMLARNDVSEATAAFGLALDAYDVVPASDLERVDNVAEAALDWCWGVFLANDVHNLERGASRLREARSGLTRAHGADLSRLRQLTGAGLAPQMVSYVRLTLLEGVVALLRGDVSAALSSLQAAQAYAQPFAVDPETHAALMDLGLSAQEATRGLRHCSGNPTQAAEWVLAQRDAAQERLRRRAEERQQQRELRAHGKTCSGAWVDAAVLARLETLGYARELAAAAACAADNSFNGALDTLSDPDRNDALHVAVQRKRRRREGKAEAGASRAQLTALGFSERQAHAALKRSDYDVNAAGELLLCGAVDEEDEEPASAPVAAAEEDPEEAELAQAVPDDPMAALDVSMDAEESAIQEYLARIRSLAGHEDT
jgi:hypothetical protein